MEHAKILVVDDEPRIRKLVRDFLNAKSHTVLEAGDGEEALNLFTENPDIDLMILDVMMPKLDGFEVVKEVRQSSKLPIIMLTARGEERDELQGFRLGVDEYISKPFSPKILVARVEAILRRTHGEEGNSRLEAAGIRLDRAAHEVLIDGKPVELSYKEFELLAFFSGEPGDCLVPGKDPEPGLELRLLRRRPDHRHPCEEAPRQDGRKGSEHQDNLGNGIQI